VERAFRGGGVGVPVLPVVGAAGQVDRFGQLEVAHGEAGGLADADEQDLMETVTLRRMGTRPLPWAEKVCRSPRRPR